MTLRLRNIVLIAIGLLILWFLYVERAILAPFIVAGIFAYILNPFISFLTERLKIHRTISAALIFLLIIGIVSFSGFILTKQIFSEWDDLTRSSADLLSQTRQQVYTFPLWAQQIYYDTIQSLEKSNYFSSQEVVVLFPKAISHTLSFVIFLFASFYFLREGGNVFNGVLRIIPKDYRIDLEILLRRINAVLGGYLRGQLFLILLVSTVLFIALTVLGIRFSLILAIFSGFAEIVPIIGPIVACAAAVLVALVTGTANFGLNPYQAVLIIIAIYFVVRHIEDYFVIPVVMERVVKLHPLIILFAVLSGQHLMGVLGLILAVPVAASIKIILEFLLDKVNENSAPQKKSSN